MSGQLLADCDPARLAALSYSRLQPGGLGSMYSATYPSTEQNPYPSIAMENSFYGSLVGQKLIIFHDFMHVFCNENYIKTPIIILALQPFKLALNR